MKYLIQHHSAVGFEVHPNRIAVRQGNANYTYSEVAQLSHRFANFYKSKGLKQGQLVGILSRVRIEAIGAMLGALNQGLVYAPLNINAPVEWLGNIIKKAGITHLLVDEAFSSKAGELKRFGLETIVILGSSKSATNGIMGYEEILKSPAAPLPDAPALADDIAYILYTSGSTGDPKGIMITHRNAYTFIDWMHKEFSVSVDDRILNRAPLQFDLSVFDIYSAFAAGACLVIAPLDSDNKPETVVDLMRSEKVTIIYTVPSAYIAMLMKGKLDRGVPSLRWLLYAGEPFPTPYLRKVMECLPGTSVSNIYGPTETNIVTYYHITRPPETDDAIPIGRPVHDTQAFIVNPSSLEPVKEGEIGEILIRGGTVFAGYFGNPNLTKERLIQSPFHSYPTLVCRTGDYGRWLPDGNIAYHGRMDSMVKTRGYRVELGEVEAAISSIEGIDEVAVVPKPHEKYGSSLHAFVASKKVGISAADLKNTVERKIPSYMVPYEFIVMPELPKTATGKIDRVGLSQILKTRDGSKS